MVVVITVVVTLVVSDAAIVVHWEGPFVVQQAYLRKKLRFNGWKV